MVSEGNRQGVFSMVERSLSTISSKSTNMGENKTYFRLRGSEPLSDGPGAGRLNGWDVFNIGVLGKVPGVLSGAMRFGGA